MHFNNNLQRNFSISPPFLQAAEMEYLREVASKFNFEIIQYGKWYFLKDTNNFKKSYFELMTFEDLYLLLTTLAELNNI